MGRVILDQISLLKINHFLQNDENAHSVHCARIQMAAIGKRGEFFGIFTNVSPPMLGHFSTHLIHHFLNGGSKKSRHFRF